MGWLDTLRGHVVGLDTAPLIYFTERNPAYIGVVLPFFQAFARHEFSIVTSIVTLVEVLVLPLRISDAVLAQQYRDMLFNTKNLTSMDVNPVIAEEAARLRAVHNLRTPDAIQMATAMTAGATHFLTNDARLKIVPGIQALVLDDLKP